VACTLNDIATVHYLRGNYDQAFLLHEESLSSFRALGDKWGTAICLNNLGRMLALKGKHREARTYLEECLVLVKAACDDRAIYGCLESLAALSSAEGAHERALLLWAAVDSWRKATNTSISRTLESDFEAALAAARILVDKKTFGTLWEEGSTMTRDEAISFALEADRPISATDSA
jgi:tetratricopeptide (TPR) repeat protein